MSKEGHTPEYIGGKVIRWRHHKRSSRVSRPSDSLQHVIQPRRRTSCYQNIVPVISFPKVIEYAVGHGSKE